ncbi:MAG: DUF4352 domain-containing protein [Ruminococcus sp.]|jgi:hypothetical protein
MKRKTLLITLTLMSLLSFSLFGCNSGGESDTSGNEPTPTEAAADDAGEDADSSDSSETSDTKTDTGEIADSKEGDTTPVEEIQGEGTTDKEVPDLSAIDTAPLNQDCVITAESGAELGTLKIEKAETTDERDENNSSNPEKVVVIDYSYTNSSDETLLLDNMSFKLVDGDAACTPYYAAFLKSPEPAEKGESSSGQIAFEVGSDFSKGTLVFDSSLAAEDLSFEIEV